jgi:hypothetical protein
MSMSLTVVLEKRRGSKEQERGQDLYLLPRVLGILDEFAARRGWVPLGSFVRDDAALFAEIADDMDEEARARIGKNIEAQPDWHDPATCVATINELSAYLQKTDENEPALDFGGVDDDYEVKAILADEGCTLTEAVCKDLEECARQLGQAVESHSRFRFEIG